MMQDVHVKLYPGFSWQKQNPTRRGSFHQQIGLKFKDGTSKLLYLKHSCMVLKTGHFGKTRNTLKVLKCGAGEEWRRSVGPIM
jgi:hypothetical protein